MSKELFGQTIVTSVTDRINKLLAFAQPSQVGAENISIVNFCKNEIGLTGVTESIPYLDNAVNKLAFDPAFKWDSINKRLGVGTSFPDRKLGLHQETSASCFAQFTNISYPDGTLFGIDAVGNAHISNEENKDIIFSTNSIEAVRIRANLSVEFASFITFPQWKPLTNTTTALRLFKADGTTVVGTLDTTNTRFGIGTITPVSKLHLSEPAGTPLFTQLTNSATGHTATDGTLFGIDASGNSLWNNQESTYSLIKVSTTDKIKFQANLITINSGDNTVTNSIEIRTLNGASDNNIIIGRAAGAAMVPGTKNNMVLGSQALLSFNSATRGNNTAIGSRAMLFNLQGAFNTSIGEDSGFWNNADFNVFIGYRSGTNYTTGEYNVSIGYFSAQGASGSTGANNVSIGGESLFSVTTANKNVVIGRRSGYLFTTNTECVCLGYFSGYYETGSKKLFIDSIDRGSEANGRSQSLIYGVFAALPTNQQLTINGDLIAAQKVHYSAGLSDYVNDAAAAATISINQLYRNGSVVMIRVT